MGLLRHSCRGEIADCIARRSAAVIGELGKLAGDIVAMIENAEALTRDNGGVNLTVALSYGGRAELGRQRA